jgi:hypothetical protein
MLCRREGIVQSLYYRWSKEDFLEAGKKRLASDMARAATSDEVNDLRREASALKEVVAELTLENGPRLGGPDTSWSSSASAKRGAISREIMSRVTMVQPRTGLCVDDISEASEEAKATAQDHLKFSTK